MWQPGLSSWGSLYTVQFLASLAVQCSTVAVQLYRAVYSISTVAGLIRSTVSVQYLAEAAIHYAARTFGSLWLVTGDFMTGRWHHSWSVESGLDCWEWTVVWSIGICEHWRVLTMFSYCIALCTTSSAEWNVAPLRRPYSISLCTDFVFQCPTK